MIQTQLLSAAIVCSVCLTVFTEARVVPTLNRSKRQDSDVQITEYAALAALEGLYDLYGCDEIACGVVDIYERIRRQTSEHRFDELRTLIALANKNRDSNPYEIERRATSDQRYAELQSLIALANDGYAVGHGLLNPNEIGKRKRSVPSKLPENPLARRYMNLLRRMIEKGAAKRQ